MLSTLAKDAKPGTSVRCRESGDKMWVMFTENILKHLGKLTVLLSFRLEIVLMENIPREFV